MKNLIHVFLFFVPIFCFGQVNDSFSDGNFSANPIWTGNAANFTVNSNFQLQSKAAVASTSFLFTPSEAMDDAEWNCWVKISYNPSSSNYASVYLVSDRSDISAGCNGYFVQIGGTNDEVSLYVQEGTKKTKIIDGVDKRTDRNPVEIRIKVTRDATGNFKLYSKLAEETDFFFEGETQNTTVTQSSYFGILYVNTSTTGSYYYFDDVVVTGKRAEDKVPPTWLSLTMSSMHELQLQFSEAMDASHARFLLQPDCGSAQLTLSTDQKTLTLSYPNEFKKGTLYALTCRALSDLAGNILKDSLKITGIVEPAVAGDLVFNELMVENAAQSVEYVEFYNRSAKLLDVSGMIFTTRKTDGSMNTGVKIPAGTLIETDGYLVLCEDIDSLKNYYSVPPSCKIPVTTWNSLNNETATVLICNSTRDTVYDELTYQTKWHHVLIKNPKGVALEKIHPDLSSADASSWHSAASEVKYGTPGSKNSQYRDLSMESKADVWLDPEAFSPDNDGVEDVCFIRYRLPQAGSMINARIFTASGDDVIRLTNNQLAATEGFILWDGKTQRGKLATAGVYVLYVEFVDPLNGTKSTHKLPIVLSYR